MDPITTDLAQATVVMLVVGGTGYLAGYLSGRKERQQTQRERVQLRRARRIEELKHRVPNQPGDEDEQGTDTIVDEPVEQTARQRMTGIAMSPAAGMRGEARILRQETREIRVISDELFIGAGLREVFAAVYGEEPERLPLYEAVVSQYETWQYPMVRTQPDNPIPTKPGDGPVPKRLVEHDGTQDPERVAAAALMHAAARRGRTEDEQPTPVEPVPTSGPRPGETEDTTGRPPQPKPRELVVR